MYVYQTIFSLYKKLPALPTRGYTQALAVLRHTTAAPFPLLKRFLCESEVSERDIGGDR